MPSKKIHAALVSTFLFAACGEKGQTTPATPGQAAHAASPEAVAHGAEPAPEPVKIVEGAPPGKDDRYELAITPPADAKAGEESRVSIKVIPKDPWHINLDFPTSLQIQPPEGVSLAKSELKKADAVKLDDANCEFAVAFTPAATGDKSFTGKFKFAVCQDEACSPVTEDVEFVVAVK